MPPLTNHQYKIWKYENNVNKQQEYRLLETYWRSIFGPASWNFC